MRYEIGNANVVFSNGAHMALPSPLLTGLLQDGQFVALVQPNENAGARNIFCYTRDGRLMWQVAARKRFPDLSYERIGTAPDGLYAIVKYGGTRVKIDELSGEVLDEQEWKE